MVVNGNFIVQRARQLADLERSEFISDEECEALLNEAYQAVYQADINEGDCYFLKEEKLAPSEIKSEVPEARNYDLPEDFYQIQKITDINEKLMAERKSLSSKSGYKLNRDTVTLYNFKEAPKLFYYPMPVHISYRQKYQGNTVVEGSDQPTGPAPIESIDVPNNWFVNYLAYYLAIEFNAKQNGNKPMLIQMYNLAKEQFYDQLKRDAVFPIRITNTRR